MFKFHYVSPWHFKFLNAVWHSSGNGNSCFLLSSGRKAAHHSVNNGRYLCEVCIDIMSELKFDSLRSGFNAPIESGFWISGITPVGVILCRSNFRSFSAKLYFASLKAFFVQFYQNIFNCWHVFNFYSLPWLPQGCHQ